MASDNQALKTAIQRLIDENFQMRVSQQNEARKLLKTVVEDSPNKYTKIDGIVRYIVDSDNPTVDGALLSASGRPQPSLRGQTPSDEATAAAATNAALAFLGARRTRKRRTRRTRRTRRRQ